MTDAAPSNQSAPGEGASDQSSTSPAPAAKSAVVLGLTAGQLLLLVLAWAAASYGLYWVSRSEWWLCMLGGLGVLLVIWPGPKPKPPAHRAN